MKDVLKDAKAVLFDFDGTVTEKGNYDPSEEMISDIISLGLKMPVGFCTGRQLESFLKRGFTVFDRCLSKLSADLRGPELRGADLRTTFLNNLHLMAENGAIGYKYNGDEFEEFYRIEWPEEYYGRLKLMKDVSEAIKEFGEPFDSAHRVVVVFRTLVHNDPDRDVEKIYKMSENIYKKTIEFLEAHDPNYEQYLHVGNSGIGVVISPAQGDKDRGIIEFAKLLEKERGVEFSKNFREVIAIGDRPQKSGNDHYFLNGDVGSPFTVGCLIEGADYPMPVFDTPGENKRLLHSTGTQFLVRKMLDFSA
jgi:hydroxymethylpyrimidine pyrophosphatase-like HAD family hydrolase